ncbi:type III restriction endonuclease [Propionigenium maris DSM 9537]|uniref:Type III restriction endonuclease n=1 Tax=Propionigenium maris DSM 9537 TaxID=1123000 RepID=A0A9W6GNG6_9FUSO|nr:DEAD/DEAH box helicase family protein [Propionigenium maris]GLI57340.1 type III restriction endonuclease [Propionigenium maris DSM 9537]
MELKQYQQKVMYDLEDFLEILNEKKKINISYEKFWNKRGIAIGHGGMKPYKNNIAGVPHICLKIPTGGGKTFVACNSIQPIFKAMPSIKTKAVVWLVPSTTILEQTIKNLKNREHPYRQKINTHFKNRVEIYTKEELLSGQGFDLGTVSEQLSIFVLSYDALRSKKKDDRKIYQENGYLYSFDKLNGNNSFKIENADETSLIQVINKLNPLVIVDESHNAETFLSLEMLYNLNPSFILDLTATPKANSNIISYVDAMQLKKENMVKLPVVVYNHHDKEEVLIDAIELQKNLEIKAIQEEKLTGNYIRPIVLFQAQPKRGEESETFDKIKEALIEIGIPKEQIAIKTSNKNELKGLDLSKKSCEIRFIITVNALKEGWDCPFAYILATLANRTSQVDVEQTLGRILRQPYVKRHQEELLNLSYVFTCSNDFYGTLENIIKGLNKSGYSEKDYRIVGDNIQENKINNNELFNLKQQSISPLVPENGNKFEFQTNKIVENTEKTIEFTEKIIEVAKKEESKFKEKLHEIKDENPFDLVAEELKSKMKIYHMNKEFEEEARKLKLPQFFIKTKQNSLFDIKADKKLSKEDLLEGFSLKQEDIKIDFDIIKADIVKIDLENQGNDEYIPKYQKLDKEAISYINEHVSQKTDSEKIKDFKNIIFAQLGKINSISEIEIKNYIERILGNFTKEQIHDLEATPYKYSSSIKKKIKELQEKYQEKIFYSSIESDKIFCKENYMLKKEINPVNTSSGIAKSLYESEESGNKFENKIALEIASLNNVKWWHRNISKKEYYINGFINHFPDFLVLTQDRKVLMIETKGDYLSNEENLKKLRLGRKLAELAGPKYKYYMVFESKTLKEDGAYNIEEFLKILRDL